MAPRRSKVWKYFSKESAKEVQCRLCHKNLKCFSNTTNMMQHLKLKHLKEAKALTGTRETLSEDRWDQHDSNNDFDIAENKVTTIGLAKKNHGDSKDRLHKEYLSSNAIKVLDSQQIFGDYVAHQMRKMTKTQQTRFKMMIQKAIIELEDIQEDNGFVQSPNSEDNMKQEYFAYNSEKNVNTCLIEISGKSCGQEIIGNHGLKLTQHIQRHHVDILDKRILEKRKQEETFLNYTQAAENYVVINEAAMDTVDDDLHYKEEPTTSYSGKRETTNRQHNDEIIIPHCLSYNKQWPIKREMIEEIKLEPKRLCMESTTTSDDETILTEAEEENEKNIIDTTQVTTFIFKGEECVQMTKEHYVQEKRYFLSELLRLQSVINNNKLK